MGALPPPEVVPPPQAPTSTPTAVSTVTVADLRSQTIFTTPPPFCRAHGLHTWPLPTFAYARCDERRSTTLLSIGMAWVLTWHPSRRETSCAAVATSLPRSLIRT